MPSLLLLGFLLGMKHALEADHVAAVSTIVSSQRSIRRASLVGAIWGLGHTTSILLVCLLVLGLRLTIPDRLTVFFELAVGLMLVALGTHGLWQATRKVTLHRHVHTHAGTPHVHLHVHVRAYEAADHARHEHEHRHLPTRSLWVGMVHGLAGSGVLTVLVLAAAPSLASAVAYVLVFGVGSVAAMAAMSALIGLPAALAAGRLGLAHLRLQQMAGALSIVLGARLTWEMVQAVLR